MSDTGKHSFLPTRVFTSYRIKAVVFRMILIHDIVFGHVYTKFTTKSEDVVGCDSYEIFIYIYKIPICEIYMFTVCTHFVQCIKIVYCMIQFHMNESNA